VNLAGVLIGAFLFLTTFGHAWFQRLSKAPNAIEPRSTLVMWLKELKDPPRQAYREAAEWLNTHAAPGSKVAVTPAFGLYPLMFHAPNLVFMWQLDPARRAEYPMLPDAHFRFLDVPDYFVSFGPEVNWVRGAMGQMSAQGLHFAPEIRLDVSGADKTRPELFWRTFTTAPIGNPQLEATYINHRVP
jgi:hypothetical protein